MDQRKTPTRPNLTTSDILGKLPPSAPDLEESVLGALIIEKNAIINVAGFLRPEHFYLEKNQEVYTCIQRLFAAANPIDMRTVVFSLRESGKLELVGGAYYVAELTSKVSSSANIEYHARMLVELSMKRSMITMGNTIQSEAYDDTIDIFSQIEKTNLTIQEILDNSISAQAEKSVREIAVKVVKEVQARQSGIHSGIDSGYHALDTILNGYHKSDLIIMAGRPGMGKTAYAIQSAKQVAQAGHPVGVISLEMSSMQLIERMAIAEAEIFSDLVKKGMMNEMDHNQFNNACGELSKLPMHIDDTPFMSIVELRARAMRQHAKYGIKLLVIDYLQLIKGTDKKQNRDQEIGEITRTLKGIAKELDIPVIALSQLSRGLETRGGSKRPQLSDLRESGNIEQDADIVIFLYRPEYYGITTDDDGYPTHGLCEVIVAKHRNGSLDTVKQKFVGKFVKFTDWIIEQRDQSDYVSKHYKDVLPSERGTNEIKNDDNPF